jgi:hypothetical protein
VYRALIVCNSRFEDAGALPELNGPKKDGMELRDALTDHETGMFNKDDVQLFSEEGFAEAGRAVEDFFAAAEPDDIVLFYYSGHGRVRGQKLFLCARNTVADRLQSTAISESMLNDIVDASLAQVKIIILDCCYSGLLKDGEIADVLAGTGRYIIAAAPATERARDSSLRGMPSPFTHMLTEALLSEANDRDGDGNVDLDDIYDYLKSTPSEGPRPQRKFYGIGAVPIARRAIRGKAEDSSSATSFVGEDVSAGAGEEGVLLSFLDNTAPGASINRERIEEFRLQMRDDIVKALPPELSAEEFLKLAGLFRDGNLTYAGLLLFGENPTAIMPTAMVQCARFYGKKKTDSLESIDLQENVPELIVRARDFVADAARIGEAPTTEGAYATTTYKFPMIAVREIIANAIVHRDYEEQESCVQVHVFSDRIEVISPGKWTGVPTVVEGPAQLAELERLSQRRNFRLARTLTWSKLVEGVGAGVPRAIADCRALGTSEPTVIVDEKSVKVTIYPRSEGSVVEETGRRPPASRIRAADDRAATDVRMAVPDRITVALIPKAAEDLQTLQERTGLSKTDIANRAITLYEFIDDQIKSGHDIIVRDSKTGESQIVRIL